jgi:hypothetical protein
MPSKRKRERVGEEKEEEEETKVTCDKEEAYVAALDAEQVVTYFATANEKLKDVEAVYSREINPIREECIVVKRQLQEYMVEQGLEWGRAKDDGVCVRLTAPTTSGRTLCPKTVVDVLSGLKDGGEEAVETVAANVRATIDAAKEAWQEKHGEEPAPCEPQPRFVGKGGLVPQRPLPPLGRALTTGELLAEVMFAAVHAAHKPKGQKLEVMPEPKRGAKGIRVLEDDLSAAATAYWVKLQECKQRSSELAQQKKAHKKAMSVCVPLLETYLPSVNAEGVLKRTLPTPTGLRTVTISLEDRIVKPGPMSLIEYSQAVDAAVSKVSIPEGITLADAIRMHYDALIEDLVGAMERRILEGTQVVKVVTIRRTKVRRDGEPEEAEEEKDNEENMFDF